MATEYRPLTAAELRAVVAGKHLGETAAQAEIDRLRAALGAIRALALQAMHGDDGEAE